MVKYFFVYLFNVPPIDACWIQVSCKTYLELRPPSFMTIFSGKLLIRWIVWCIINQFLSTVFWISATGNKLYFLNFWEMFGFHSTLETFWCAYFKEYLINFTVIASISMIEEVLYYVYSYLRDIVEFRCNVLCMFQNKM